MAKTDIEQLSINTIRTLSMDSVQQANAGHPGTAMALAPLAYLLYGEVMRHNPAHPHWPNRDRCAAQGRLGDARERDRPRERVGHDLHPLTILEQGAPGGDDLVDVR